LKWRSSGAKLGAIERARLTHLIAAEAAELLHKLFENYLFDLAKWSNRSRPVSGRPS